MYFYCLGNLICQCKRRYILYCFYIIYIILYYLFLLLQCAENHGMFARQTQLILLDEAGNRTEPVSPSSIGSNATTPDDSAARARSRLNR